MFEIEHIKFLLKTEQFYLSQHALKRTIERNITIDEVVELSDNIGLIEEYPDDKYLPSCLALGFTKINRPLHIQITVDSSNLLKIITIYEPDEIEWLQDLKTRR